MKFKRKILKNGMRVITVNLKDTPAVTVLVMVETGSKYETKDTNGISHFLEHMCFKGTAKRPNALTISTELDSIGAQYNAFTGEEFTGYYAKAAPKQASKLLDVVSDIYLHSVFNEQEIQKEKGVIIEEINMYKDLPHRHVQELFTKLLYGDQPAGWGIAGTKETVSSFAKSLFESYRKDHYVAEATTLIVAGSFDEKKIYEEILERFKPISNDKKKPKVTVIEKQAKPALLVENRTTDQSHIVLGVRGFGIHDKRTPALKVLNAVLGAGMSSRLFQKLREEMGVGYYVRSSYDTYTDHGTLSVSVGSDIKRVPEVVTAVLDEFKKMKNELVSSQELEKTKEYIIGTLALGLETSDSVAEFYGYQEVLRQKLKMPRDFVKEVKAITAKDIQKAANDIFVTEHLNLAIVGPVKDQEALQKLLVL